MKKTFSISRLFSLVAVAGLMASGAAFAQSASPFQTLSEAQPSDTPNKVEVLEFFAFNCPHCNHMEPLFVKWAKTLPSNVAFIQVPVAWNKAMEPMQRLYYTLIAQNRSDLIPKVFEAIHEQNKPLFTKDAMVAWIGDQGVDKKQFSDTFDSFGVTTKVKRANELTNTYKIEGTPSIAIGGQYITSPGMTGDYASSIKQAQDLLDKVLASAKK